MGAGTYIYPTNRAFLNLSGGTVTGVTYFTSGLSASTLSATTINLRDSTNVGLFSASYSFPTVTLDTNSSVLTLRLFRSGSGLILNDSGWSDLNQINGVRVSGSLILGNSSTTPYKLDVSGNARITQGLTANTITATTISANTIVSPGYTFNLIDNRNIISHTGTLAETIVFSQAISGDTLQTYDSLRFFMRTHRLGYVSGTDTIRWYLSSGATLPTSSGSEQIATYGFTTTSVAMVRNMWIYTGSTLQSMIRTTSVANDEGSSFAGAGHITTSTHIFSAITYFICTVQLGNTGNSVGIYGTECQVKRKSY